MSEIFTAFAKAQSEMSGVRKDSTNPHFRSKYASLAATVEACLPALNQNGFSVVQRVINDGGEYGVQTTIYHASGDLIDGGTVPLIVNKNDSQGFGSALTYSRRQGLQAAVGIAPEDDDGNAAAAAPPAKKAAPKKPEDTTGNAQRFADDYLDEARECEDLAGLVGLAQREVKKVKSLKERYPDIYADFQKELDRIVAEHEAEMEVRDK